MKRYKISWRMSIDALATPEQTEQLLDLMTKNGMAADEFWIFLSEETSHAYDPLDRVAEKCERFRIAAERVRARGIRVGINPWPTFGADGGPVPGEPPMPFQPMVGFDGKASGRVACPISPEFLEYTRQRFRLFAQTGCDFIWVDDDCRFTHLGGASFPCFCPRCVSGFENGRYQNRETLIAALNAPENRELRRAWSAYSARRLAAYCSVVRAAVDEVDPSIETPFMSVGYSHTTFSGDYIHRCMEALRSKAARPGHGFYWDEKPMGMFEKVYEMSRQLSDMPQRALEDVQYEEESHPCTPLNKAAGTRLIEAVLSIWGGCTGIAMNHLHDAGGKTPFAHLAPETALLGRNRAFFDRYLSFAAELPQAGIWAAFSAWTMSGMKIGADGWFREGGEDYNANRFVREWPVFGIPVTADPRGAYATLLQGRMPDVFSDTELDDIFQKPVFLDGQALEALWERGFGERAGARVEGRGVGSEELAPCEYTREFEGACRPTLSDRIYTLRPVSDRTQTLAYLAAPYGGEKKICAVKHKNVVTLGFDPYAFTGTPGHMKLMRSLEKTFGARVWIEPTDDYNLPRVAVFARADEHRAAVLLINSETTRAAPFRVCFTGDAKRVTILGFDRLEQAADPQRGKKCVYFTVETMEPWQTLLLLWE